ncbi:MAG: glutamine-hydrolyzing carbamoyl-phosphate synthase small subunit [Candidatus Latescibacteria bacterium]|nr:glutamine-hydrolyzing carbamoyl-phosphate synthase small subunit [Candidatus Latescibacterota bacterium]NIM22041.1 glutamine-hydrolyzing carbamoyl-phosphate synthase small subunit [Candidatus Latescibacterota bacterium]NIM66059.1 glutamine-hydrolyzing carbamoyl-phosphate synthase small subunit [Candidatus Latescibacterota bacterium]NIO02467.1 glutamine-hydrolyzing carbamoyl-phosphate synthase small subunit [Candidatus Latescibacterota bacterium]NIO29378.1 glutamine-hydrolyzing carbamoyl-phos
MDAIRNRPKGKLILADGARFDGYLIGSGNFPVWGEVVFNTSMTGYQEVITDPSYAGQLIVMTYPQIGNYGVSSTDSERSSCAASALVVRELSPYFSPGPDRISLEAFMVEKGLPGLSGVDTRAITRRIRSRGAVIGVIGSAEDTDEELLELAREKAYSAEESLVQSVSGTWNPIYALGTPSHLQSSIAAAGPNKVTAPTPHAVPGLRAALIDLGTKKSIIERVQTIGVKTAVFDVSFDVKDILAGGFDFLVLSNGPGDPADVPGIIRKVESLLGSIPILGICLGHQIVALAMGGRTYKMKFGHRGANQPVLCRRTGRISITSQNHGYAVSDDLERTSDAEITYVNSNDGTVEGFCDPSRDIDCVQFHPEASPGPQDTVFIFEAFCQKVRKRTNASVA